MSDVKERVQDVVSRTLKIDCDRVIGDARFVEDLGAESIQSVELIAAFEDEFDVEIDSEDALEVKTVEKAIDFIGKLL